MDDDLQWIADALRDLAHGAPPLPPLAEDPVAIALGFLDPNGSSPAASPPT